MYNYGRDGDVSEESDHFMDDRQTDEDYSAYRERIFDWSPRKNDNTDEKRVLVQEIQKDEATVDVKQNKESVVVLQETEAYDVTGDVEQNKERGAVSQETVAADVEQNKEPEVALQATESNNVEQNKENEVALQDIETSIVATAVEEQNKENKVVLPDTERNDVTADVEHNKECEIALQDTETDDVEQNKESEVVLRDTETNDLAAVVEQDREVALQEVKVNNVAADLKQNKERQIALQDTKTNDVVADIEQNKGSEVALRNTETNDVAAVVEQNKDREVALQETKPNDVAADVKQSEESEVVVEEKEDEIPIKVDTETDTPIDVKEKPTNESEQTSTIDWRKIREKYFGSDTSTDDESSEETTTEEPYYKILDVCEDTVCSEDGNPVAKRNKLLFQSIKKNLTDIKELMDWNFKPSTISENKIILKPWDDVEENEDEDELDAFKLMESALRKKETPEFEVREAEVVVNETDVIRYAKNIKNSINTIKQNETVRRVLTTTQTVTVMQMQDNSIVEEDKANGEEEEEENSVMMAKGISEIRTRMAEFRESLDTFTNKYKAQYSSLIKTYNDNCERYDRTVRAIIKKEMEEEKLQRAQKKNEEMLSLIKVEVSEEEFMKQMESMVGEENLGLLRANDVENDAEMERLQQACLNSQNYFENERENVATRNITRTLEMQLAEED